MKRLSALTGKSYLLNCVRGSPVSTPPQLLLPMSGRMCFQRCSLTPIWIAAVCSDEHRASQEDAAHAPTSPHSFRAGPCWRRSAPLLWAEDPSSGGPMTDRRNHDLIASEHSSSHPLHIGCDFLQADWALPPGPLLVGGGAPHRQQPHWPSCPQPVPSPVPALGAPNLSTSPVQATSFLVILHVDAARTLPCTRASALCRGQAFSRDATQPRSPAAAPPHDRQCATCVHCSRMRAGPERDHNTAVSVWPHTPAIKVSHLPEGWQGAAAYL